MLDIALVCVQNKYRKMNKVEYSKDPSVRQKDIVRL